MSEDDADVVLGDGSAAARVDRDRRAPRFSWTPAYEATFFRSLCESVQLGLRENSSFKAEAWERAAQALQESHGAYPTKSHLINKSDNARKRFRLWRGLREDLEFAYNPVTRTVTATEEAWSAHIEREPLSRALRGRPFDHEDYMEVLYPDVIGSGGAPKRIMKPRRRTDGPMTEDSEMPGTSILNLQSEPPPRTPGLESPNSRPLLIQTPTTSSAGSVPQRSTSTIIPPRSAPPPSTSALTPPDESMAQNRKRQLPPSASTTFDSTSPSATMTLNQHAPESPGKRRRTSSNDEPQVLPSAALTSTALTSSALNSSVLNSTAPNPTALNSSALNSAVPHLPVRDAVSVSSPQTESPVLPSGCTLEELIEAVRSRTSLRWQEEALDVFFRDFAEEDLDLQVKMSESVLVNESKAMVFCKMPARVRSHWVRRFREGQMP